MLQVKQFNEAATTKEGKKLWRKMIKIVRATFPIKYKTKLAVLHLYLLFMEPNL